MSTYPVMVVDFHDDVGQDGGWSYTGEELPAPGDEIVIAHSSGLPGGDSMAVRVRAVRDDAPFTITATMLW